MEYNPKENLLVWIMVFTDAKYGFTFQLVLLSVEIVHIFKMSLLWTDQEDVDASSWDAFSNGCNMYKYI